MLVQETQSTADTADWKTQLVELQSLAVTTGNREFLKSFKSKKAVLTNLLGRGVIGALVRSRFLSVTEIVALSHSFFRLEKREKGYSLSKIRQWFYDLRVIRDQEACCQFRMNIWRIWM